MNRLSDENRDMVVRQLTNQGDYVFITLAKSRPLVLDCTLTNEQWVATLRALFAHIRYSPNEDLFKRIAAHLERQDEHTVAKWEKENGIQML